MHVRAGKHITIYSARSMHGCFHLKAFGNRTGTPPPVEGKGLIATFNVADVIHRSAAR